MEERRKPAQMSLMVLKKTFVRWELLQNLLRLAGIEIRPVEVATGIFTVWALKSFKGIWWDPAICLKKGKSTLKTIEGLIKDISR